MKANHGSMVRGLLPKTCRSIFDAFVMSMVWGLCVRLCRALCHRKDGIGFAVCLKRLVP